ncbi:hypothetical protein [Dyadobacter jejuensis]|nr:hypothetical protein [Dyadobacter jejuensis]
MNFKTSLLALVMLAVLGLSACKEDAIVTTLDPEQLVAGRLGGTWAKPTNIVTPEGVPSEVFGAMRLVLTTDELGKPSEFLGQDCPIIFSGEAGTWAATGSQDDAKVMLTGITPVDEFTAKVNSSSLIISFRMGWENTDTGVTGEGDFSVTLSRQ